MHRCVLYRPLHRPLRCYRSASAVPELPLYKISVPAQSPIAFPLNLSGSAFNLPRFKTVCALIN